MNISPNRDTIWKTIWKTNGEKMIKQQKNNTIMNISPNHDTNGKQMERKQKIIL